MADYEFTALDLLTRQHREVERLFEQVVELTDVEERRAAFDRLADKLLTHTRLEEELFYPAVTGGLTEDLVMEAYHDHGEIKRMLVSLLQVEPDDPIFAERLLGLQAYVDGHVIEEEEELFPAVLTLLSDERLAVLAGEMTALERQLDGAEPRRYLIEEMNSPADIG